ncbi:hypothetical protein B0I35DRAFT_513168 [Stachybotrys elegans]|uniref:Uncharacterized protein n=1 Tax=Stachybotrys elegans TaxID=80388 RepID=A0A8K0SIT3_9HYPO|nr:hypothetical protein B0I35DRAFT_513168 [Stachybotrys elegans]
MKTMLFSWAVATGLALTVAAAEAPEDSSPGAAKEVVPAVEFDVELEEAVPEFNSWTDFEGPLTQDTACLNFRSLQWFSHVLIKPTEGFAWQDATLVFSTPKEQSGSLVLVGRSVMIWTRILQALGEQLAETQTWSLPAQLRVAGCYLEYTSEAAAWLEALLPQACDFDHDNPAKCLMFDKIKALKTEHLNVAKLIYAGQGDDVQPLIQDDFPEDIPSWFETPFDAPKPGTSISDYIAKFDKPLADDLLELNLQAWTCDWSKGVLCRDGALNRNGEGEIEAYFPEEETPILEQPYSEDFVDEYNEDVYYEDGYYEEGYIEGEDVEGQYYQEEYYDGGYADGYTDDGYYQEQYYDEQYTGEEYAYSQEDYDGGYTEGAYE